MFRFDTDRFRLWRKVLRYQLVNLELGPLVGRDLRNRVRDAVQPEHSEHAHHSLPEYAKQRRRPWLRRSG
jgi:hypothetical protein